VKRKRREGKVLGMRKEKGREGEEKEMGREKKRRNEKGIGKEEEIKK
jgi:hypothetical protein